MSARVIGLAVTPVKGTRLGQVERIDLDRTGARGDRRFFVVDARNRMVNSKIFGELQTIVAVLRDRRLRLTFSGGMFAEDELAFGEELAAQFFSRTAVGRVLEGPWASALSEHLGQPLRLVESEGSVDRGPRGAASLISRASLERLAEVASEASVDSRRFRMLIEIDGVRAHEEDAWVGRSVRVGEAVIRWTGHVGRCLITSRDPETGVLDLPTLDILASYRGELDTTEPLPFGIYGAVVREGSVRVGDEVAPA